MNADDAIESYMVQSLELSYVPRNPPFFDWLLWGLQQIVGTGLLSFALLRYALLAGCALLVWRIARQVIADPRLQALAVYSLTADGDRLQPPHPHPLQRDDHRHRRTFLTLDRHHAAAERRAVCRAGWLDRPRHPRQVRLGRIPRGGAGDRGAAGAELPARPFRPPLLVTLLTVAVPLGIYAAALYVGRQSVVAAAAQTMGATNAGWDDVLNAFVSALPAMCCRSWRARGGGVPALQPRRGRLGRTTTSTVRRAGAAHPDGAGGRGHLVFTLAAGTESLRDRYFHAFLLLPVYVFAELERLGGWRDRLVIYLGLLLP